MPEVAAAALLCMYPEALASSDPVERARARQSQRGRWRFWQKKPSELSAQMEARGGPKRIQNTRTGIRVRQLVQASRPVVSTVSLASPSWWASDELFVSSALLGIPLGTQCSACVAYQIILPANTRTLPDCCCQTQFAHSGGHSDGNGSHNLQQRSIHVCIAASPGQHFDGCSHAQISLILKTRRWHATKIL